MEVVLTCTVFGAFIILSYTLGLKNGQKIVKSEKIDIPNPIKKIKQIKEDKEEQKIIDEYQKLLDNINNYDMPGYDQKDVKIDE